MRIVKSKVSPAKAVELFWAPRAPSDTKIGLKFLITAHGKTQTLAEWAEETGLHRVTLRQRVEQARRRGEDGDWIVRPRPSFWVARGSKVPGLSDDDLLAELTGYHGEPYLNKVRAEMKRRGLPEARP